MYPTTIEELEGEELEQEEEKFNLTLKKEERSSSFVQL